VTAAFDVDEPIYGIPPDIEDHCDFIAMSPTLWHLPRDKWKRIHEVATGKGVVIGVGDTGYTKHQFGPQALAERSFVSGQSVRDPQSGHGTHCIGTALGRYDGDQPIGVAPAADLVVAKVLSDQGSGSSTGIAAGIRWMADQGCDIISLSLGGPSGHAGTNEAIDYAWSKGCIVNSAAGNSGFNGSNTIGWPARYRGSLCTASYAQNLQISNFSSGGPEIDWACPGSGIVSFANTGSGYRTMSGTSMATPFGSGVLALIVEVMRRQGSPRWTAAQAVREFFKQNMKDMGAPGFDQRFGWGIPIVDEILTVLVNKELEWA
jgi:subtilisin family serine protease